MITKIATFLRGHKFWALGMSSVMIVLSVYAFSICEPKKIISESIEPIFRGPNAMAQVSSLRDIAPAPSLIRELYGEDDPFEDMSTENIAKILNYLVFNLGKTTMVLTDKSNKLRDLCKAGCGGYSTVMRDLLSLKGIKTRFVNLYNLPQQGNHSMVEVEIGPSEWALFDPTFGSFFTVDGKIGSRVLSMDELRFMLSPDSIEKHVLVAANDDIIKTSFYLDDLYRGSQFVFPYMKLSNYLIAEKAIPVGAGLRLPLTLVMDLSKGQAIAGRHEIYSVQEGKTFWLQWTNKILNNSPHSDHVSYHFINVGDYHPYYKSLNIIKLTGCKPGAIYDMTLSGFGIRGQTNLQIVDIGRNLMLDSMDSELISESSRFVIRRKIRALNEKGLLILTTFGDKHPYINIFGISVVEAAIKNENLAN